MERRRGDQLRADQQFLLTKRSHVKISWTTTSIFCVFFIHHKKLCASVSQKFLVLGAEAALIGCCSHRPFCFLMMVQIMQISGNFPGHGTPATHPVLIPMNKRVPSTRFQFEISSFFSRGRLMCATRAASFNARIPPPLFLRRQVTALIGGKMSSDSLPPFDDSPWFIWIFKVKNLNRIDGGLTLNTNHVT